MNIADTILVSEDDAEVGAMTRKNFPDSRSKNLITSVPFGDFLVMGDSVSALFILISAVGGGWSNRSVRSQTHHDPRRFALLQL